MCWSIICVRVGVLGLSIWVSPLPGLHNCTSAPLLRVRAVWNFMTDRRNLFWLPLDWLLCLLAEQVRNQSCWLKSKLCPLKWWQVLIDQSTWSFVPCKAARLHLCSPLKGDDSPCASPCELVICLLDMFACSMIDCTSLASPNGMRSNKTIFYSVFSIGILQGPYRVLL